MKRKKQASILRTTRKIHRWLGTSLFIFFLVVSLSGLLLGWKKNSGGYILPETHRGTSSELVRWLPIDSLQTIAHKTLLDSVNPHLSTKMNRIDARPDKGMLKFVFEDHHWSIQLDGATGKVLNIGQRRSDWIENIHDGSIIDDFLGTNSSVFKLIYSSIMGVSLLGFTVTGFWLWYGPKRMRNRKK
ncbi:PepSY domain-containing protein [Psychroflexus sediminis]|uniref:PepSY-associated TM region n=1 Tax=Psychroflexus sediminis TaxID=470826 RepID=A0A1G7VYW6_9FLAO|nr:PepSY domain-containing protein [Psychroflexus sediminis]SDG64639.1 PepSY-associated TM region [Psychroflexus sediminis]